MEFYINKLSEVIDQLQQLKQLFGDCEFKIRIYKGKESLITRIAGFARPDGDTVELVACMDKEALEALMSVYQKQQKEIFK